MMVTSGDLAHAGVNVQGPEHVVTRPAHRVVLWRVSPITWPHRLIRASSASVHGLLRPIVAP